LQIKRDFELEICHLDEIISRAGKKEERRLETTLHKIEIAKLQQEKILKESK
jgi:hypothetical protein